MYAEPAFTAHLHSTATEHLELRYNAAAPQDDNDDDDATQYTKEVKIENACCNRADDDATELAGASASCCSLDVEGTATEHALPRLVKTRLNLPKPA